MPQPYVQLGSKVEIDGRTAKVVGVYKNTNPAPCLIIFEGEQSAYERSVRSEQIIS